MVAELGLENGAEDGGAPQADWPAIRQAYEGGDGTITDIAERFGITRSALSWRVKTQQWRMRNKRLGATGPTLLARLFRLLERQIYLLESEDVEMSDKRADVLGRVATTLDRLMQIERTSAPRNAPKRSSKDLAYLRNKIAQRLDELERKR